MTVLNSSNLCKLITDSPHFDKLVTLINPITPAKIRNGICDQHILCTPEKIRKGKCDQLFPCTPATIRNGKYDQLNACIHAKIRNSKCDQLIPKTY